MKHERDRLKGDARDRKALEATLVARFETSVDMQLLIQGNDVLAFSSAS
jgi:hypothetical protein